MTPVGAATAALTGRPVIDGPDGIGHGDWRLYNLGCRCRPCTDSRTRRDKGLQYARESGFGYHVEPTRAAQHIRMLRLAGMTEEQLSQRSRVPRSVLWKIKAGQAQVTRETERRILAVQIAGLSRSASKARVPAAGTHRRLQALLLAGWTRNAIADRCGVHYSNVTDWLSSRTVYVRTADKVERAFRGMLPLNPVEHGVAGWAARKVSRASVAAGFLPAGAWDDIDDPACVPDESGLVVPTFEDRYAAVIRVTAEMAAQGAGRRRIAASLGVQWETIRLYHWRAGVQLPKGLVS